MNTTARRLLCLSTFTLVFSLLYSQTNYRPGFIITLGNDTIYGEIDFRTDQMNSKRCVFRAQDTVEATTYHPFDILGYRFTDDGKYYVSKSISLKYGTSQPVFLEYLLKGIRSLYYYESEGNIPIYFVENGDILIKVDAPKLAKQVHGYQFKGQKDRYIPVLHYAFSDCPELSTQIDRTRFNRKGLVKLAKDYHYAVCTSNEDCIEFEAKEYKRAVDLYFTPYAGIIQYSIPTIDDEELSIPKPDLSYLVGVTITINSKRWMSTLSGCADLSLSRLVATNKLVKRSATMLSGKVGIRYTYPKGKIRPFAEAGLDISGVFSSKIETENESDNWIDAAYPGYYVNAGLNFKLSRTWDRHLLSIRVQFKDVRDVVAKTKLTTGWAGVIGYTF